MFQLGLRSCVRYLPQHLHLVLQILLLANFKLLVIPMGHVCYSKGRLSISEFLYLCLQDLLRGGKRRLPMAKTKVEWKKVAFSLFTLDTCVFIFREGSGKRMNLVHVPSNFVPKKFRVNTSIPKLLV